MTRRVLLYLVSLIMLLFSACSNSTNSNELDDRQDFSSSEIYLLTPDTLSEFPPSGFYDRPFVIGPLKDSVRCAEGGLEPTADSPAISEYTFNITKTIRCVSFKAGSALDAEIIRTYIFETPPTIPAIFLTADPKSLFDPDTGIYMEGKEPEDEKKDHWQNYWQDKEIPVFVELMELDSNEPAFAEKAGLKIFGGVSRGRPKKSVAIAFRKEYGANHLRYVLFPEFPNLKKFNNFILRNNGNNFDRDYIRDRLASSISEGLGVDYQRGRFVIVYYNGEYYGIHDLREKSNEHYFETHYGIKAEELDLVTAGNRPSAGSSSDYVAMLNWLESNHLDDEKKYEYISSQLDVDNYINYMQTELFADNRDWPANNIKKWRGTNPVTKWKFFLYDLDFGLGYGSRYTNNIFEFATAENGESWPNGPRHTLLFRRLLENEGFRTAFVNRMAVLLQMNFESSRILARIEKMMNEIKREIPRDQKRWNQKASVMNEQLEIVREFAKRRPNIVYEEMREFFSLGKAADVFLSSTERGTVAIHGLKLDSPSLKVRFFEGLPVTLSAEPLSGGVFMGWSDGVKESVRTILPEEKDSLTAFFK